jgi:phospholipid/cholesterol/gamma-HCH transport system substrate-binding protein
MMLWQGKIVARDPTEMQNTHPQPPVCSPPRANDGRLILKAFFDEQAEPEVKVGIFLICVATFYAGLVLGFRFEKGFELQARFNSVEGLPEGAQVEKAGIKVGDVKKITWERETGKALVVMDIKSDYRNSITEGSRVTLKRKGVLGDRFVVIEPDKPSARKLKSGEKLCSRGRRPEEMIENPLGCLARSQGDRRGDRKQIVDSKAWKAFRATRTATNSSKMPSSWSLSQEGSGYLKDHIRGQEVDQLLTEQRQAQPDGGSGGASFRHYGQGCSNWKEHPGSSRRERDRQPATILSIGRQRAVNELRQAQTDSARVGTVSRNQRSRI